MKTKYNLNSVDMVIYKSIMKVIGSVLDYLSETKERRDLVGFTCILTGAFFTFIGHLVMRENALTCQMISTAVLIFGLYLADFDMNRINDALIKISREYCLFCLTLYSAYKLYTRLFKVTTTFEYIFLLFLGLEAMFYVLRTLRFLYRVTKNACRFVFAKVSVITRGAYTFVAKRLIPGTENATKATESIIKLLKNISLIAGTLAGYPFLKKLACLLFGI